jgi:F0F1-type ATP synthase delta subunit
MKAPRAKLAQAIADRTLKKGASTKALSQEVAAYLLSTRRVNELDSVLRDVQADWAKAGFVEVIASSAHPLSNEAKADITKQVTRLYPTARIIITEAHDPAIMGGVRLSVANQQLDLSVEAKLNMFKQLTTTGKGKD